MESVERVIAYQGVEGSYSSIAAAEYDADAKRTGYPTFDAVVDAVQQGAVTHALLPIENSTAGRVADLHHLLPDSGLTIIDEHFLPVRHALIGLTSAQLTDITHVYSHREALAQCTDTLRALGIEPVPFGDTAKAVAYIAEEQDVHKAALASVYAASLHEATHVLKENMQDAPDNVTRFLILAKNPESRELGGSDCITSIVYDVLDTPAALYDSLGAFAEHGVNIIKLESFVPMQRHKNAQFYLECIGGSTKPPLRDALLALQEKTKRMLVLGTYRKSPYRAHFEQ